MGSMQGFLPIVPFFLPPYPYFLTPKPFIYLAFGFIQPALITKKSGVCPPPTRRDGSEERIFSIRFCACEQRFRLNYSCLDSRTGINNQERPFFLSLRSQAMPSGSRFCDH